MLRSRWPKLAIPIFPGVRRQDESRSNQLQASRGGGRGDRAIHAVQPGGYRHARSTVWGGGGGVGMGGGGIKNGHRVSLDQYNLFCQVRIPPNGRFRTEDGERYYRHAKGARITKSSHFDYEYELGHKIVFVCVAKGKPRPKIVWFKDGAEIYYNPYYHVSHQKKKSLLGRLICCLHFA